MRLLRVTTGAGTFDVDIDDKTAIGIDLQAYDIKEPGKRKVKISNQFTVPSTIHNMKIFGYPNDPQSTDTTVYDECYADYWIDNEHLIDTAKLRVEEVDDERISIFIFEKPDIWDLLKQFKWPDFVEEYLTWLQDEKGLEDYSSPFTGTFQQFIDYYSDIDNAHLLFFPMYFGNLLNMPDPDDPSGDTMVEGIGASASRIYLTWIYQDSDPEDPSLLWKNAKAGHFCTKIIHIFEFLEYKYGENFFTSGTTFTGNLWDDPGGYAQTIFTPLRDIELYCQNSSAPYNFYFRSQSPAPSWAQLKYSPEDIANDKAEKSVWDFINAFFQHFNVMQEVKDDGIHLYRWDSLNTYAEIVDWSNKLSDKLPKFKPLVDGYKQTNYIRLKEVYEGGDTSNPLYQKVISCLNKNIDAEGKLFDVDAFLSAVIDINGTDFVPNLSEKESFKTFHFFVPDGTSADLIAIYFRIHPLVGTEIYINGGKNLVIPALYSLDSEYTLLEEILEYPKFYEAEFWLTLYDIIGLEFFKKYYIKLLNGCFYLNKISGFNPEKSRKPTKVELIKVSDEAPPTPYMEYWVDGIADEWTDGLNNFYF